MCGNVVIEILNADILEPLVTETIEIPGNIVWCDGLKPSYPQATTPLSDTDKFLVRQGKDWNEVGKSELSGKRQLILTFNFRLLLDKDGKFVISHTSYGVYVQFSTVLDKTLFEAIKDYRINGTVIPKNYYLKELNYQHRHCSADIDMTMTVVKSKIKNGDNAVADNLNAEIITQMEIVSPYYTKSNVKKTDIPKKVFGIGEQLSFMFNSNVITQSNAYTYMTSVSFLLEEN